MPSLETPGGKTVPIDADAVNKAFDQTMNDDPPDQDAPPRRPADPPADEKPKRTRARRPREPKAEKSRTTAAAPRTLTDEQRAEGVKGIYQVFAGLALMYGKGTGNPAYEADAMTLIRDADDTAVAVVSVAQADPQFAARLDKVCGAGPYAAVIVVLTNTTLQIARNHRPTMQLPGTVDPMELLTNPDADAAPVA